MHLNPVLAELGGYPIAEIQDRARAIRSAGGRLIDFSIGDPREPTPSFIVNALRDAVPAVSQYPTALGLPQLREAVAAYVDRRFGVTVDPATQVMPTSGSKEAIFNSHLAFVDRAVGDVVIYGTPGYPVYERGARFAGASVHPVALRDDFVLRAADIDEVTWERARIVWINSPHNPSGAVTSTDDLAELVAKARATDTLLFSDDCYTDLHEGTAPVSPLQLAGDDLSGLISFMSCSKRSGMTGYRSGVMVGDAAALQALRGLRATTGTASAEFVQLAAAAAWQDDAHVVERREIFAAKRSVLREAFADLGYETVASEAGLYLWLDVGDDLAITDLLLQAGVVVSPGRFFGVGGEGYIRLALVPTIEECRAAVDTLREVLPQRRPEPAQ